MSRPLRDDSTNYDNSVDETYQKEQKALFSSFKPKEFFGKVWETIHSPIKTFTWFSFTMLLCVIIVGTVMVTKLISYSYNPSNYNVQFNNIEKISQLKKTYEVFRSATKEEILVSWIDLFSNSDYSPNGDPKYNKYDCVGALNAVFNYWGANIPIENVATIVKRCNNLAERGELHIRTSYSNVQPKDIIVIQTKKNDPSHVGMVWNTNNGYIQYVDVNAKVQTIGFNDFKFGDWHIYKIYEVSYSLWVGDLLKNLR